MMSLDDSFAMDMFESHDNLVSGLYYDSSNVRGNTIVESVYHDSSKNSMFENIDEMVMFCYHRTTDICLTHLENLYREFNDDLPRIRKNAKRNAKNRIRAIQKKEEQARNEIEEYMNYEFIHSIDGFYAPMHEGNEGLLKFYWRMEFGQKKIDNVFNFLKFRKDIDFEEGDELIDIIYNNQNIISPHYMYDLNMVIHEMMMTDAMAYCKIKGF